MKLKNVVGIIILALALAGCKSSTTGPGGGGLVGGGGGGGNGGGGGGNNITSITVSGHIQDHFGLQNYHLEILLSHDQTVDDNDYESDPVDVNLAFSNVSFDVPQGYGANDYVIILAVSDCIDADGDGYADDRALGAYPDLQNNQFVFTRVQSTFSNITLDAQYYIQDACGGGKGNWVIKHKEVKP